MNFKKAITKKISVLLIVSILTINFSFLFFNINTVSAVPNPETSYCILGLGSGYCINAASDLNAISYYTVVAGIDPLTGVPNPAFLGGTSGITASGVVEKNVWDTTGVPFLEGLFKTFGLLLINDLTAATVDWINNGFRGNPAFVDDPGKLFTNLADQTVGAMISNDPALNFLCSPFQLQVKLALAVSLPTFQSKITCTLGSIANNYQAFLSDVNNQTWQTWLQITTVPQNNPLGAYIIAQDELAARIGNTGIALSNQLNMGGGALNYEKCTETKTDKKTGKVDPTFKHEYQGNAFLDSLSDSHSSADPYTYSKTCQITTPGSTIASMLGAKANSTQTMSQLAVATGNGVDAVLNALLSKLIQMGINALKNGMLDGGTGSPEYNSYMADLNAIAQQAKVDFTANSSASSKSPSFSSFKTALSGYDNSFVNSTSSANSTPFSQGITLGNDNISYYSDTEKTNAISAINYYLKTELAYQNTLLQASSTLTNARAVFVTARSCNIAYNSMSTTLRGNLINSNVIKNIDGIINTDSYRTLAQIPWDLATTTKLLDISNAHIDLLNTAVIGVNNATSSQGISDALIPVNSTAFNTDPQKNMVTNIKTWLKGVQGMYSTKQCPIDLTKILATSTSATSTKSN